MIFAIVCKANQARSILLEATLKFFYPECDFISFGTDKKVNLSIPQSTLEFASAFGINEIKQVPQSISILNSQSNSKIDFFICADRFVERFVKEFDSGANTIRLSEYYPKQFTEFRDLQNLNRQAFNFRMFYFLLLETYSFRLCFPKLANLSPSTVFIPQNLNSIERVANLWISTMKSENSINVFSDKALNLYKNSNKWIFTEIFHKLELEKLRNVLGVDFDRNQWKFFSNINPDLIDVDKIFVSDKCTPNVKNIDLRKRFHVNSFLNPFEFGYENIGNPLIWTFCPANIEYVA